MPRRILITGSRNWSDRRTLSLALKGLWEEWDFPHDAVLVEGGARGADAMAREVWSGKGYAVETVPADWETCDSSCAHRPQIRGGQNSCPAAGPKRNQEMVDRGADICLAFPTQGSVGTWDCVRKAEAAGIPVRIIQG